MPPTTTARATPAGIKLKDGHSTKIAFEADPDVSFWERTVKPPGIDGGDAVEQTTMHSVDWRQMAPRQLKTLTDATASVQYDPNVFNNIYDLVNIETSITVHFPDGSTLDFFGYLKSFEPDELAEGEPPTATITIVCTNSDPTSGAEAAPVLTSVAGT